MNFTERLRQLRNEQELSQKDLGKKLHLGTSAISMYERGEREPDFEKLETIADYFNVNIDYLLGKSDERKPVPLHCRHHYLHSWELRSLQSSV